MSVLHRIVIVGGGAGGLELATQLGHRLGKSSKAQITLVDQKLTHIWKPLLHEIAAGTLNPHQEETNYFVHAAQHHYQFILGTLIGIDRTQKKIQLQAPQFSKKEQPPKQIDVDYDTLVLALGSTSNDFHTEGVKQHCHFLDSLPQATVFHQDLLHLYLEAQNQPQSRALNIAIIGAGATGVELAAELYQAKQTFAQYGLNRIDPQLVRITLIEAADRILPALSQQISRHTQAQLERFGIEVLTQHRVAKVDEEQVYFAAGNPLEAEIKVWAAGIQAPEIFKQWEDFEKDHLHRLKVYATLQTYTDPNIFAFGDCAHCQPKADEPVLGPRAQVASQQASFLVRALSQRVNGKPLPMFKFSDKGSLISLSQHTAVGELLGRVNVQGMVAKSMYVSLYRLHQATIHGYTHAGVLTAKDMLGRKIGPKIKLH
ncbi:NAD(P)/FAD-dependent oxidoreductase [Acinetobacter indicus]|uniref:NAD(P)/FAD-dependent oxidoreductase n=1 Tax=Acinetobacter indicus TaxID=756892 RepID=UPI000CEC37C3|nr:NAD(P)/FAD-dependent oxidoreductase [Acinetobacter indicus]MDM1269472.1 NAD(P)/FAD-dependent oxidoreductase [Acinetobacter indicus]